MYTLKKSLGQHFLKDENVCRLIVAALQQNAFGQLLEVGPGGGALTKYLLQLKDIDFKGMEESMKKMKPELEKSMQNAKESIEKAKKELLEYKGFIDGLDKDGLIDKDKSYTIQYKNGELTINGKKQSAEVVKKYNGYLKGKKDFTIKKDEDHFNIDKD